MSFESLEREFKDLAPTAVFSTGTTAKVSVYRSRNVVKKVVRDDHKRCVDIEVRALRLLNSKDKFSHVPQLLGQGGTTIYMSYGGERVTQETLPKNWKVQVVQICQLLRSCSLRHNDIKPEEVLVKDGTLVLVDFSWVSGLDETPPADYQPFLKKANDQHDLITAILKAPADPALAVIQELWDGHKAIVKSATYQSTKKQSKRNVTEQMRAAVEFQPRFFASSNWMNDHFGDPCPGSEKELVLEFELEGREVTLIIAEQGALVFPPF